MSIELKFLPKKLLLMPTHLQSNLVCVMPPHPIEHTLMMMLVIPKRARTDDDAGDTHEQLAEVDNWDLRDHRQQVTHGKTAAMYKSGLARINKSLAQARTASCITLVLVWLGGFHIGVWGTLL